MLQFTTDYHVTGEYPGASKARYFEEPDPVAAQAADIPVIFPDQPDDEVILTAGSGAPAEPTPAT